jgi:hypothetical protein
MAVVAFVHDAWVFLRKTGTSMSQMQFRHSVSQRYSIANPMRSTRSGSSSNSGEKSRFIKNVTDKLQWWHRKGEAIVAIYKIL